MTDVLSAVSDWECWDGQGDPLRKGPPFGFASESVRSMAVGVDIVGNC